MKVFRGWIAVALTVGVAILATGCSGGDQVTIEEFVNKVYEIDKAHETIAVPLRAELGAKLDGQPPDHTVPAGTLDVFTKIFDEEADFANKIEAVDVPKEYRAQADEVVASMRAEVAYGRGTIASFTDQTTIADFAAAFEGPEAAAIEERRSNGCVGLQKLADDNGVAVDMTC